jgi:hypothetical protein
MAVIGWDVCHKSKKRSESGGEPDENDKGKGSKEEKEKTK